MVFSYLVGLVLAVVAFFIGRATGRPQKQEHQEPASILLVVGESDEDKLGTFLPDVPKERVTSLRAAQTYNEDHAAVDVIAIDPKTLTRELARLDHERDDLVLREKVDAMSALSAGIAHEVANPIGFVTVSTENMQADLEKFSAFLFHMMGEDAEEEDVQTFKTKLKPLSSHLEIILDGCERIRDITRELQHFARTAPTKERGVKLMALVDNMVGLAKTRYKRRVNFSVEGDGEVKVKGRAAQINHAILALILNGCQAVARKQDAQENRNPGQLRLVVSTHEHLVELRVEDSGDGIPGALQDKVFQAGFSTRKSGGTGMGLTLARHVAQAHGGRLSLFSTAGEGTTATMILPKAPSETNESLS